MPAKKKPAKKADAVKTPARAQVAVEDTWDLSPLFKSDAAWQKACKKLEKMIPGLGRYRNRLGRSAKTLHDCLAYEVEFDKLAERIGSYAFLKASEDLGDSACQGMVQRYTFIATRAMEVASYIAPEVQAIPKSKMKHMLQSSQLAPFRFRLEKLLRYKPHILSEPEERLLAMQGEVAGTASSVFRQLLDADLKFGDIQDEKGRTIELTQSSFSTLLESRKRTVRKQAFHQFYGIIGGHENALAEALGHSVKQDIYQARVRNYPSAREAALFSDKVPVDVYDNLIATVHDNLDAMHYYFDVRKRALKLKDIHFYDVYCPLVNLGDIDIPYDEAVDKVCASLEPLGAAYVSALEKGLRGRWVDRYENVGKRSGAFSAGGFTGPPYILMNYRASSMDSMFTLAHEAGHSMHTYHSARNQPFQHYDYTIFVAEVASTFNEQLLNRYLLDRATSKKERAYLINRELDEIRGTIVRQTMFAEFEKIIHAIAEAGEPLTKEQLRGEYRKLLDTYFGPGFVIDDVLSLEGMRIPHFYHAFYVYKYATGLSAAIALAEGVLGGGEKERKAYLNFLSAGGSKFPLDLLRDAGVDMGQPGPIVKAMARIKTLTAELEDLM